MPHYYKVVFMSVGRGFRFKKSDMEGDFLKELDKEMAKVTHKVGKVIVKKAKTEHRYKNRTGDLMRSTRYKGNLGKRNRAGSRSLEIVATEPYAKFIHNGFNHRNGGRWKADRFITNAIKNTKDVVNRQLQNAIDRVIKRMNRRNKR
jgi:hypothetical protein